MVFTKKLVGIFLLTFFLNSLFGQSAAQSDINLLEHYFRTMDRLEQKPRWESKSFQIRYKDYVGRIEKAISKIKQKDRTYDLSEASSKLAAYQQILAANTIAEKATPQRATPKRTTSAYSSRPTKSTTTNKKTIQQPSSEQDRIAQMKREMEVKIAAQNAANQKAMEQLRQTSSTAHAEAEKNRESDRLAVQQLNVSAAGGAGVAGVTIKTPCGRFMEYCVVDGRGQTCTQISGHGTTFRRCTFPVKVYLAKGSQKTTLVATVTKSGQTVNLCE
ncbi:MAG: hypothetical protein AAGJ18_12055 [Bacteroidota bacterium]